MDSKGNWKDNQFTGIFRCTTSYYADLLIQKGSIKFNTPQSWVEYAKTNGQGRGDKYEGTLGLCHSLDIENLKNLYAKYISKYDIYSETINQVTYFKNKKSMELPCYCVYAIKNTLFNLPKEEGRQKLSAIVEGEYFRDFANNLTEEEVEQLPVDDRPSIVVVKNFDEFKKRLVTSLCKLGLKEDEILVVKIDYLDFKEYGENTWLDFRRNSPYELSVKQNKFAHQNELRIIINTDDESVMTYLKRTAIEIGDISDIAQKIDHYFFNGLLLEMDAIVKKENE